LAGATQVSRCEEKKKKEGKIPPPLIILLASFYWMRCHSTCVFGSVIMIVFQIAFHAEIHANDFFYFLKIIFDISISKRSKKYKPHSILAKKKKIEI
jgi:hypothetical protein